MPSPRASFPSSVWDGDTINPDRDGRLNEVTPNHQDWDRLVSEVIATQGEVATLKGTLKVPSFQSWFLEKNQKTGLLHFNGGMTKLVDAGNVNSSANLAVNTSCARLMFVLNSAGDANGTIQIKGTRYSPLTGNITANATELVTINGVSTDGTANTTLGTPKYAFGNAYLSRYNYSGNVVVSTNSVNITDVDVYAVAFKQNPNVKAARVTSLGLSAVPSNVAAQLDLIVYEVHENRNALTVSIVPATHMQIDGSTPIVVADRLIHLDRYSITSLLDTANYDGFFISLAFYPAGQAYWEQVEIDAWVAMYFDQAVVG